MKKRSLLLTIILLFTLMVPMVTLAESANETPLETEEIASDNQNEKTPTTQEETGTFNLAIDDKHVYEGMDKAYQNGYSPQVKNGIATIVLPLITKDTIKENTITVTPNLGDPASSPFTFKNYQKKVSLKKNKVNKGAATISSYLIRFDLALSSARMNGVYPVEIQIEAEAETGNQIQQSFTSYITITDGKNPNIEEPPPVEEKPAPQPKVVISSVDTPPITAGESFTLNVTLKNTSETQNIQNMTVTATVDSPHFLLQNNSDTSYIANLGKGQTTDLSLTYKTDLETPAQQYNLAFSIAYENSEATAFTSTGTVPVSVSQPLRVAIEGPQVAEQVNAGDTIPLSMQVMNLGRSMIYNVRFIINGPGLIPSGTGFIGNMEAGTAQSSEIDIFVGTKDMTEGFEGDDKYGETNGILTLIYEDGTGKEHSQETEFSTIINKPVLNEVAAEQEQQPEKASQWWISITIGGTIIIGFTAFLLWRNRRLVKQNEEF
ncbi:COG1361 family protein [Bacillus niameyensis]|uniref:hypothetical protein n=1 Tax=Bacillus niameyensis TaxID=1522308 RepID=UPI00078494E2|nr:hypothetical protein [Bacillus niameyensis]